jgi:hypothetical protein
MFYYAGPTCWVKGRERARNLETVEHAIDIAREENLGRMEIVAKFDAPGYELVFPIQLNNPGRKQAPPIQSPGRKSAAA